MAKGNGSSGVNDAQRRLLEAVEPALALPDDIPLAETVLPPGISIAQHPIASKNVVWLRYCGLDILEISQRTGLGVGAIKKFLSSGEYHLVYARQLDVMLSKTEDTLRQRLQSVVLEAVETKLWLMRNAKNGFLRNRVASELITLGREIMQLGKGNVTDLLKAVHEQAIKEGKDGARTTTQRITLEGDPAVVAAALRRTGDGANGDSQAPEPDDPSGPGGSGERSPKIAPSPGSARRDGDSGPDGV